MASTQPSTQKPNFDSKKSQKTSCKTFHKKPTLLNFVNLPTTFPPRLSEETKFHFYLGPDPLILNFLKILVFEKTHLLFKLIFKLTQLQKIPEYDIFRNTNLHFSVKYEFGTKRRSICSRALFMKRFYFSLL